MASLPDLIGAQVEQDPTKPIIDRAAIVRAVRRRLGAGASEAQVAELVAKLEKDLKAGKRPDAHVEPPPPTYEVPKAEAADATNLRQTPAPSPTPTDDRVATRLQALGMGIEDALPKIVPGIVQFGVEAAKAAGNAVTAPFAREALARTERAMKAGSFLYETAKGLLEPVADVAALAANTATGTIEPVEKLERIRRAGATLANLLALEGLSGTNPLARAAARATKTTLADAVKVLEAEDAKRVVTQHADQIVAEAARSVPDNGVQNPVEVGVRDATAPAPIRDAARPLQSLDTPEPSRLGVESTPDAPAAPSMPDLLQQSQSFLAAQAAKQAERGSVSYTPPRPPLAAAGPDPAINTFFAETAKPPTTPGTILQTLGRKTLDTFSPFNRLRTSRFNPQSAGFDEFFADARELGRQGIDAPRLANAEAVTFMHRILHQLNPNELEVFRQIVFLRDMVNTAGRGIRVSRDLNPDAMATELTRLERLVATRPELQDALQQHVILHKTMTDDLLKRGILTPDQVAANPHYMTHQVLDYLEQRAGAGAFGKVRTAWRGYARKREGSALDIYTDYLEVQYAHLAKMLRDNKVDDLVQGMAKAYDIRTKPLPGRAEGLVQALEALKAQQPRAGYRDLPDHVLAQHGYARYYPASPRAIYQVRTVAESQMAAILDALANDPTAAIGTIVEPSAFRNQLAVSRGQQVIIPKELAGVLEDYRAQFANPVTGLTADAIRGWKQLVLNANPIRYNRRNFLGDLERTWAAVPEAVKHLPRTIRDQMKILKGEPGAETFTLPDGTVRRRYDLASETGVISSGRTATEVGRVREIEEFKKFAEDQSLLRQAATHPLQFWSRATRRLSGVREDWLRLAVFYENLDRIAAKKPLAYGVSNPRIVDAITDPVHRAAKISRETLGDYGALTAVENRWRNGPIPFYAWMKISSSFWPLLLKRQGLTPSGGGAALSATARLTARVGFVYAAMHTWNNLMMGDQEDSLPDAIRTRFHLNTGMKDTNGRWITLTDPTALDDFFQTVGLEGATPDLRQLFLGQLTLGEYASRRGYDLATGAPSAVVNRFGPELTLPLAAVGVTLYPDPFHPREVPPGQEVQAVLQNIGFPRGLAQYTVDAARGHVLPKPDATPDLTAYAVPLGITQTAPLAEPDLVQSADREAARESAYLDDLIKRQGNILSGLSLPNATPEERAAEVARLDELIEGQVRTVTDLETKAGQMRARFPNR